MFLKGGVLILLAWSGDGFFPPYGAHFRYLASSWRSWALSWPILALSRPILSPSCFKMAPRWPNIAQHSAKMSQHSLQEQPQDPKKPSKVMYCRRFFGFRHFWQDRAQDPKKVAKMLPKMLLGSKLAILGTSWRQVGQLSAILAHLGAKMSPTGIQIEPQMRPKSHLGPSWRQEGRPGPQQCP